MTRTELYLFAAADGQSWRFTSADRTRSHEGLLYAPVPIRRSGFEQAQDMNRQPLDIHVSRDNEMALEMLRVGFDMLISVTVFDATNPGDVSVVWKGRVADTNASGSQITIKCESIFTSQRRPGLRARYQKNCRHVLYGRGCWLNKDDWAVPGTVTAANGATITVPDAALHPDGYFTGGMVRAPDGTYRWVIRHAASTLVLSRPSIPLAESPVKAGYGRGYGMFYGGAGVSMYPGCDRTVGPAGCGRFNNLDNHGGFRWIPPKNPMGGAPIY